MKLYLYDVNLCIFVSKEVFLFISNSREHIRQCIVGVMHVIVLVDSTILFKIDILLHFILS